MKSRESHKSVIVAVAREPLWRVLRHSLLAVGVEAEWARSHGELLRCCSRHRYRLIISSFVAPLVARGGEVERLRGRGRTTHLFILAHTRDERVVVTLLERGVNQFLTLPVSLGRLCRKVKCELEKYQPLC